MHGVLQWVLRPVYTLAYFIQRLIRRVRAAIYFYNAGYHVLTQNGSEDLGPLNQRSTLVPYIVTWSTLLYLGSHLVIFEIHAPSGSLTFSHDTCVNMLDPIVVLVCLLVNRLANFPVEVIRALNRIYRAIMFEIMHNRTLYFRRLGFEQSLPRRNTCNDDDDDDDIPIRPYRRYGPGF